MIKRTGVLLTLVALLGCSTYLISSKWRPKTDPATASADNSAGASADMEKTQPLIIPEGTEIETRLLDTLSTKSNRVGDRFTASIERPVMVDGIEVIPRDATAEGVVTAVKKSGRIKGQSYISLRLETIELKNGARLDVSTNAVSRLGKSNRNRNLALLGGGAGIGAAIGAIAGGGKGLAIGGPVGFGAGLATKALMRGHEVTIPAETLLHFRLSEPMSVNMS